MFVFAEEGPSENFGLEDQEAGAGVSEGVGEVSEQFSEQMRKDQAALKALYTEEKKTKKKDVAVAGSIAKFLQDPAYEHIAFLVAKLVSFDTPADFILGILALIDQESKETLLAKFDEAGIVPAQKGTYKIDLEEHGDMDKKLSDDVKSEIDEWIYHIYQIGTLKPGKVLQAVVNEEGDINLSLTQLASFVMEEFLKKNDVQQSFESINTFITMLMTKILTSLKQLQMQHELPDHEEDEVDPNKQ